LASDKPGIKRLIVGVFCRTKISITINMEGYKEAILVAFRTGQWIRTKN